MVGAIDLGSMLVYAKVEVDDDLDYQWYRVVEITRGPSASTKRAIVEPIKRPVPRA